MRLPADRVAVDGDTAWIVLDKARSVAAQLDLLDRPCDLCEGAGEIIVETDGYDSGRRVEDCPDCVNGRHTWTLEVVPEVPTCTRHDPCDCTCYDNRPPGGQPMTDPTAAERMRRYRQRQHTRGEHRPDHLALIARTKRRAGEPLTDTETEALRAYNRAAAARSRARRKTT